ncbi:hypothetical protein H8B06_18575 [Sphingobacterium sp. DN00404]|uniref:Uncharacterized protein n=1 Tax=Sphingobacterium micropteri TaxID=2763501 RepID=A0ABR7YU78_9SPHI|nr:hypothetical protein [Sphingobacterium micropteri]MBD1434835.1 hypothetical protein [Sphingobacterium micropteri]
MTQRGIGNRSFKSRLDKLYPNRYQLTTEQKEDIYYVKLEIELHADD